jgi:hypothetical protein
MDVLHQSIDVFSRRIMNFIILLTSIKGYQLEEFRIVFGITGHFRGLIMLDQEPRLFS